MDIIVRSIDKLVVLALYYHGPFEEMGESMATLKNFAEEGNITYTKMLTRVNSLENMEIDICIVLPDIIDIPENNLNLKIDIIRGKYAVHALHGPYDLLPTTWREFCTQIPSQGYTIGDGAPFEIYETVCEPGSQGVPHTDLYMPIV